MRGSLSPSAIIDQWRNLKCNSQLCFGDSPDQPCLNEHWVVTERLAPLRAAFNKLSEEDQEHVRSTIMTTVVFATETEAIPPPQTPELSPAELVAKYIQLRNRVDEIKAAHKERIAKAVEIMQMIEAKLMAEIDRRKEVNIKCEAGIAFTQVETSATVEDWPQTLKYIQDNQAWELLEARVAKGATLATIAETKQPVPGVKVNQTRVLRVRKA